MSRAAREVATRLRTVQCGMRFSASLFLQPPKGLRSNFRHSTDGLALLLQVAARWYGVAGAFPSFRQVLQLPESTDPLHATATACRPAALQLSLAAEWGSLHGDERQAGRRIPSLRLCLVRSPRGLGPGRGGRGRRPPSPGRGGMWKHDMFEEITKSPEKE